MEIITHPCDSIALVALVGRLDADGVDALEKPFIEATVKRGLPTVVDMSGISFMSSLGIGFLFKNTKTLKKAGCKLVLLNPEGMVADVLRTSKMDKVMPIFTDIDEAIRAVGGDPEVVRAASPETATATAEAEQPADTVSAETPDNILKLTIANEMSELSGLYETVNTFLTRHRVPYRSGYAVNLAIEELVVNVIRYAYVDDGPQKIDIGLGIFDEQIGLEIRDAGRPFDPRDPPEHDPDAEDLDAGGLGLILVLDIVDSMNYRRDNDHNHVQVTIQLRADESGELWSSVSGKARASSDS